MIRNDHLPDAGQVDRPDQEISPNEEFIVPTQETVIQGIAKNSENQKE